jgi:GNAT superfamily N-acetyltransferase
MQVRERCGDDLDELVAIAARVHRADAYPIYLPDGDFIRFLTRPKPLAAWVALLGGDVVGHIALNAEASPPVMRLVRDVVTDGAVAFVARLLVDPSARRRGAGARLLDHARSEAIARGLVPMLDVVDTPSASAAISLYRRQGWQEEGRTTFTVGDGREFEELVFRGPAS